MTSTESKQRHDPGSASQSVSGNDLLNELQEVTIQLGLALAEHRPMDVPQLLQKHSDILGNLVRYIETVPEFGAQVNERLQDVQAKVQVNLALANQVERLLDRQVRERMRERPSSGYSV